MKRWVKISIDKLTLCGDSFGSVEELYRNSLFVKCKTFAKFPYRHAVHFLDGSVLQIAEKDAVISGKIKELRYEFNPNNTLYEKEQMQVLKLMKNAHATRIDIAFDVYDIDMSKWKWIDSKSRNYNVWYSGTGEVETWYIGGKESEMKLRIYNKAKEQKLNDKIWWRVEVQLRGKTAEMYRQNSITGKVDINPFNDIVPVIDGDFPELDIKMRAMVKYLIQYPSGFEELSKASRAKYKKIIQGLASWGTIDFRKKWEEKSAELGSELQSWVNLTQNIFS